MSVEVLTLSDVDLMKIMRPSLEVAPVLSGMGGLEHITLIEESTRPEVREPPTDDIAPDGDLILVVGKSKRRLRVYSLFLRNASRVFAAMLSSQLQEGHFFRRSLVGAETPSTCELPLPEDDEDGIAILCRVLHGRSRTCPSLRVWDREKNKLTGSRSGLRTGVCAGDSVAAENAAESTALMDLLPGDVLKAAIVADKYDCLKALVFAAEYWVSGPRIATFKNNVQALWDMMTAAYWFDHAEAFKQITLTLLMAHEKSYLQLTEGSYDLVSSLQCAALLEGRRSSMRAELSNLLVGAAVSARQCSCGYLTRHAMDYLQSLKDPKIALLPQDIASKSILDIIAATDKIPTAQPGSQSRPATSCKEWRLHQYPNYKVTVMKLMKKFQASQSGLCLECVKRNKGTCVACKRVDSP